MGRQFSLESSISDGKAKLSLRGRFDFSQYSYFKEVQAQLLGREDVTDVSLDMSQLDYLDSAALGILLVMLDRSKEAGKRLVIANASGVVREILDVAHFERMFEFED